MKWIQLNYSLFWILLVAIVAIIGYYVGNSNSNNNLPVEEEYDTVYNRVVIDSIKYNIVTKDSIITNLIYEYEIKVIEIENMSDSASVELFKDLCTSDSLYGGDR